MIPVTFPEQTGVYEPGDDLDERGVEFPVYEGHERNSKRPVVISCWRLNKEDLEEVQRTGCIWLVILDERCPPLSIQTTTPFI